MNKVTDPLTSRLSETLNMYLKGEDLTDSPYIKWGRELIKKGTWFYNCKTEANLQHRQRHVIALYRSFKKHGYIRKKGPISVYFNWEGKIYAHDGFHRLSVMQFLGIEANVDVVITKIPPKHFCKTDGDFPLVQTIMQLNRGRNLYQPVSDPRLRSFIVWRPDSPKRLRFILKRIKGKTVLDIGCCEGYFTHQLAKRGFKVTAIDSSWKRVAVTRYLATLQNLDVECEVLHWYAYFNLHPEHYFDTVVFFSVFHHDIFNLGVDRAFKLLSLLRGRVGKVFFEVPLTSKEVVWAGPAKQKLYRFSEFQLKQKLEKALDMRVKEMWHEKRPVYMLVAK